MSEQGMSEGEIFLKGEDADGIPAKDRAATSRGNDDDATTTTSSAVADASPHVVTEAALDRARRPSNEGPSRRPAPPPPKRLKPDPIDDGARPTDASASSAASEPGTSPAPAAASQPTPDMASEEGGVNQAVASSAMVGSATSEATDSDSDVSERKYPALRRASSVGSLSDFSSASGAAAAATTSSSRNDDTSSPVCDFAASSGRDGDDGANEYPAAPPTTPLSHASSASSSASSLMLNWDGLATPLPVLGTSAIRNASRLVEEQKRQWREHRLRQQEMLLQDGGMTPLPDYRADKDDDDGGGDGSSSAGVAEGEAGSIQGGAAESNASASADSEGGAGSTTGRQPQHLPDDFSEWAVGDRYEMVRMLGRGSYGEVAQAIDLSAGRKDAFVAIKRVQSPFDQEIDAIRLYREIHILRRMRGHECIIQLLDIVQPPTEDLDDFHDLYMVFEYVDTDLYKLIMSPQYLTTEHIQTFLYQMLVALKYIHSLSVIHRDLKPANILLNEDCSLKICDFGLARIVDKATMVLTSSQDGQKNANGAVPPRSPPVLFGNPPKTGLTRQLTKHVVTRWYRAPELILIQPYTSAVDIWSVGCILAELLSMQDGNVPSYQDRKPIFPGGFCFPLSGEGDKVKKDDRMDQLNVIFKVIGTPPQEDVDALGKASDYIKSLGTLEGVSFQKLFPVADPSALDLLRQMLQFNPSKRCTAEEALSHQFFTAIRRHEFEKLAEGPLQGPDFLETQRVDLRVLKQQTYDEVRWFRDHGGSQRNV